MKKSTKRLLTFAGLTAGAAAAATASAYVTTKYLVNTALDREPPKIVKKAGDLIAGTQTDNAFLKAVDEASAVLEARENETVSMTARDGIELIAHYIPAKKSKRLIIAFHGWRSSWHKDFGTVADFWYENGCDALYVEQRGQNNSGGEYMGFGLTERYDCLDWINWAVERFGSDVIIYLAGVSMGATTVLMASGLDLPQNVHGIFADCGFTSPKAIWRHVAEKNLHIGYGPIAALADAICMQKINFTTTEYSTTDALKVNTNIPVMFVHGTDDHFVPIQMTYENYRACAAPKTLLVVPGADHAMSHFVEPERYEAAAKTFMEKYDKVTLKRAAAEPQANAADVVDGAAESTEGAEQI